MAVPPVLDSGATWTATEKVFLFNRTEAESIFVKLEHGRLCQQQLEQLDIANKGLHSVVRQYEVLDSLQQTRLAIYDSTMVAYEKLVKLRKRHWYDVTPFGICVGAAVVIGSSWIVANVAAGGN